MKAQQGIRSRIRAESLQVANEEMRVNYDQEHMAIQLLSIGREPTVPVQQVRRLGGLMGRMLNWRVARSYGLLKK